MKKEMSAIELKDHGNKLFSARKYEEAISCYSKAIIKNPTMPMLLTNRSLSYLKLQQWELASQDARRALDIDSNLLKGHFFLGHALLEQDAFDEAIKHLQRAADLAKDQKLNFGDDIASQLRNAKKRRWTVMEEKRIRQEIELQIMLNELLVKEHNRNLQELKASGVQDEDTISKAEDRHNRYVTELNTMFSKIDDRRQKREVPDYLCGKISFEIMREPVITPSGITYDRKDIEEHLQRVGHFDPVTRTPLTQDQLIPNLAMKEVVDVFLAENEWAVEF